MKAWVQASGAVGNSSDSMEGRFIRKITGQETEETSHSASVLASYLPSLYPHH